MTIWTPISQTAQTVVIQAGSNTNRAFSMDFKIQGLNPGNEFKLYVNNVDMSYAAKQFGKKMGAAMISDQAGELKFQYLGELMTGAVAQKLDTVKYHLIELRDNLNITRSMTVIPQRLSGRRTK